MSANFRHRHTYEDAFAEVQSNAAWARLGDEFARDNGHDDFSARRFHATPSLRQGLVAEGTPADTDAEVKAERSAFKEVLVQGGAVIDLTQRERQRRH